MEVKEVKQLNTSGSNALTVILQDKTIKAKETTTRISKLLLDGTVTIDALIESAGTVKDVSKATLIEALEYASRTTPEIINQQAFKFVVRSLKDVAPRIKLEAARVIANTANLFPKLLKAAVANLLSNTEHSGNVVRWSAATALSKIILLNTSLNKELIPAAQGIIVWEEDNAVRKIYQQALNKVQKQV
jgi:HEAT repeat protein